MKRQGGFTVVEVTMFLAISASLLLLIVGLQALVARQRFQDSMTTLRTTIQSEYEEVRSGINTRLGTTGSGVCTNGGAPVATGASKCYTIGKLIRFNPNSTEMYINYVVATTVPGDDPDDNAQRTDEEELRASTLYAVGAGTSPHISTPDAAAKQQTVRMQWGSEFTKGFEIPDGDTSPQSNIKGLAILRSPISSAILVFAVRDNAVSPNNGKIDMTTINPLPMSYNVPMAFLIKNGYAGFPGAAVCIDRGSSSSAVRLAIPAEPSSTFSGATGASELRELCSP
ncbi:hypothetical protein FWG95_03650 [Candidatus Saccharibacteria bacterium]|nr:hypothetical protein [Candidatus Saccharibacteria bacterium]